MTDPFEENCLFCRFWKLVDITIEKGRCTNNKSIHYNQETEHGFCCKDFEGQT